MKIEGLENAIMVEIYNNPKGAHRLVAVDTIENANKLITKIKEQDLDNVLIFVVYECLCTESQIRHKIPDDLVVKGLY